LNAARRTTVLLAVIATACFAAPAWGQSCKVGLGRAGVLDQTKVKAIQSSISALTAPQLQDGYATAWVGVGRTWRIRVGLRSTSSSSRSRVFYEVTRNGVKKIHLLDRWAKPGDAVEVGVRKWRHHPRQWRVYVNGNPATDGIAMRLGGMKPSAAAESWNEAALACNSFDFDFRRVRTKRSSRDQWQSMRFTDIVEDPGYELVRRSQAAFVAKSSEGPDFVGDWETGDRSQWNSFQHKTDGAESDQLVVGRDPVRQGSYAAKFIVHPGDVFGSGGERSEVVWHSGEGEGDDYWYGWSTLFPTDWTAPSYFGIFMQWHSSLPTPPPIAFSARDDTALVQLNTGVVDASTGRGTNFVQYPLLRTLSKGRWNDFIVHVHWSLTAGSFTVWNRTSPGAPFTKVLELADVPTLQAEDGTTYHNYTKLGLYRWTDPVKTDYLFHDDFRRAPSLGRLGLAETQSGDLAPAQTAA
jgi:Polysaccharide lyase